MNALAIALLAAGLPALVPARVPANDFQVVARTANFVFLTRDAKPVAPEKNQKFLDETSKLLGARVVGQAAYYRYEWPEEIGVVIGMTAWGAALTNGEILSTRDFDAHEIVHRVALELGDPGPLFNEGLAVELGDHGVRAKVKVDETARRFIGRVRFRALADHFRSVDPDISYPLAGSFVKFLIKRHGIDRVTGFFRGCGRTGVPRDTCFAEQFGQSLDDAGRDWSESLVKGRTAPGVFVASKMTGSRSGD